MFPFLDSGNFDASLTHMNNYKDTLYEKMFSLNRSRQAELCLYTSLIYFGNAEFQKAHKFLSQIILRGKDYYYLPLYRTIRLVNLMILYKLEDFDLIKYEIRSMKRDLMDTTKDYKIERSLFRFLSKKLPNDFLKQKQFLETTNKELSLIFQDVFEHQILRIYDFTAWVESLIRKISLSEVLMQRVKSHNNPINIG